MHQEEVGLAAHRIKAHSGLTRVAQPFFVIAEYRDVVVADEIQPGDLQLVGDVDELVRKELGAALDLKGLIRRRFRGEIRPQAFQPERPTHQPLKIVAVRTIVKRGPVSADEGIATGECSHQDQDGCQSYRLKRSHFVPLSLWRDDHGVCSRRKRRERSA